VENPNRSLTTNVLSIGTLAETEGYMEAILRGKFFNQSFTARLN